MTSWASEVPDGPENLGGGRGVVMMMIIFKMYSEVDKILDT